MGRRSKSVPIQSAESNQAAEGEGGSMTSAPDSATSELKEACDQARVGTSTGMSGENMADGEAWKAEKAEEGEPPPFTMALAFTLTGLRVFLVDQAS